MSAEFDELFSLEAERVELIKINHHNRQDCSQLNDYIEHFHEGWIFIFILDKNLESESKWPVLEMGSHSVIPSTIP